MIPQALPASAFQVAVTDTATSLLALIRTAATNAGFDFSPPVNFVVLQNDSTSPSGFRYSVCFTPTSLLGIECPISNAVEIKAKPENILLIRTAGSNAKVNVQVFSVAQSSNI